MPSRPTGLDVWNTDIRTLAPSPTLRSRSPDSWKTTDLPKMRFSQVSVANQPRHSRARDFSFDQLPAKSIGAYAWRSDSYEEWNKETRLDIRTGSRAQVARKKENIHEENRQNPETDGGRDPSKGIRHRAVIGFPRIILVPGTLVA
jgi:hypothetical protein